MDSVPFLFHCLLTLSCAICLCTGLNHICERHQIEVQFGNTVTEIGLAMRLVWVGFFVVVVLLRGFGELDLNETTFRCH